MPSTDTIRGIDCRGLGDATAGYVDMDSAGSQARFFAVPNYEATRGIYPDGRFPWPHLSAKTDSVANTDIGEEYARLGREFGLPENFELLSMAGDIQALNANLIEPARILRFLDLGAKRNTLRDFAGSLRPAASGMQSYSNFCKSGPPPRI